MEITLNDSWATIGLVSPLRRYTSWLMIGLASMFVCAGAGAGEFTIVRGLSFSDADPALTMDLYLPQPIEQPVPCVITIQGGGFLSQDGQRFKHFAEHLAKNRFAAALISYRGRPSHLYRDTLDDVKASVRFVRSVAPKYRISPERMGATGRSAGGTLAALLAVTGSAADPESRVQAAVCFAGVYDFVARFTQQEQLDLQPGYKTKMKTNGEWIGTVFSPQDRQWIDASAISHVDREDPPILFLHSRDDSTVPWQQSREMHRVMSDAGVASELKLYETGGHTVTPKNANSLDDMVAFFRRVL